MPKQNFVYTDFPSSGGLHSSRNIFQGSKSRIIIWMRHVARLWERRGVYRVLMGKHEGMRPLGRSGLGWEDNIKMDLQEVDVVVCNGSSGLRIGAGSGIL